MEKYLWIWLNPQKIGGRIYRYETKEMFLVWLLDMICTDIKFVKDFMKIMILCLVIAYRCLKAKVNIDITRLQSKDRRSVFILLIITVHLHA